MSVPKLRFKADDGSDFSDWEKRKIGNFVKESNILGHTGKEAKKLTVKLWGKGVICKKTIFNGSENTQYYVRRAGQLIYGKLDFLNCAFGIIPPELDGYESTLDSPAFDIHDILAEFLLHYIIRKEFYKKNGDKANGSRKAKRIHPEVFLEMPIMVPSLPEQQKITDFLSAVDTVIEKQQATVEAWEQRKKGVMQKLFNQEVRFKADDGSDFPDWEEKKLGNALSPKIIKQVPTDEAPLMAFVAYKGVSAKGDRYDRSFLVKNADKKYKRTDYDDFIYSSNNLDVGSIGLNKYGSAVISDVYEIFSFKSGYIPDFMNALIQCPSILNQILSFRQGCLYGQYRIYASDFLSVKVNIPTFPEQQKIADCLSALDDVIKKQKEILEKWQELKKGLLQQMFV